MIPYYIAKTTEATSTTQEPTIAQSPSTASATTAGQNVDPSSGASTNTQGGFGTEAIS